MRHIGFQQLLYRCWRVLSLETVKNLPPEIGIRPKGPAGEQMITFDSVVALADRHFCGDQADVADVVLRTGVMAAGEMDVERRVDPNPRLAPVGNGGGVALGIGSGEFA